MLKKIGYILFAIILSVSLLTPLVSGLFPMAEDISIVSEFDEEDQKEGKKELELKDLFFSEGAKENNFGEINVDLISDTYKFKIVPFSLEVFSPPPEVDLLLRNKS